MKTIRQAWNWIVVQWGELPTEIRARVKTAAICLVVGIAIGALVG